MKKTTIAILAFASLSFVPFIVQPAEAQLYPLSPGGTDTGTSILAPQTAPVGGYAVNPQEYLTVSWSVSEPTLGNYVYGYTINNPNGDVLLNDDGTLTSSPESVDNFQVSFNTSQAGALVSVSQMNAIFGVNQPGSGVYWYFNAVSPNSSTGVLSFTSDLAPIYGDGQAQDSSPPSPWSSTSPGGTEIPIPDAPLTSSTPEPETLSLLGLAGVLWPSLRGKVKLFRGRN